MIRRALVLCAVAAVVLAPPASASEPDWTPAQLEQELMCVVCNQRLDQSQSPIADEMRVKLREWHAQGVSEQQVKDRFVAQFGQRVLAAPPRQGFGLLAWIVPGAVVLVGALVAGGLAVAWSRSRRAPLPADGVPASEPIDEAMERRIDRELQEDE